MSLSEVVQKLVKVVNNLVDEVGDIEDKTGIYDDKIAALESKSADQAVYNEHINAEIEEINNTISELPTYDVIEDIRTDINNINSSVADLDTRVTVLEGQNIYQRLDTAEQNIANLGNDIDALELDVSNINVEISGIKNRIDNLEDCCTDVQENINEIQGDITTINEDMSDILDDITDVQGDITNINGNITSIQGNITNIQGDITDVQGDITALDNRLNSLTLEDLPYIRYTSGDLISYPWSGYNNSNELVARMCQLIDTHGSKIATLISDFFLDYDLNSGDSFNINISEIPLSGYLTGSSKQVYFTIPRTGKLLRIDSAYSYTLSGKLRIRGVSGYCLNNIEISTLSYSITPFELGYRVLVTLPSTATSATNTPVSCYFDTGSKLTITLI